MGIIMLRSTINSQMRQFFYYLLFIFCFIFSAHANDAAFLAPDEAFRLETHNTSPMAFNLHWKIAPNYHLYSDSISVKVISPTEAKLAPLVLPQGKAGTDPTRGQYMEYYDKLDIPAQLLKGNTSQLKIAVSYQGCSDQGLCYPPQTKTFAVTDNEDSNSLENFVEESSNIQSIHHLFAHQNAYVVLLSFFVFGLLLALTPCVFPMLPILSSILAGQHADRMSTMHAFLLSLVYVLASAVTFAIAGIFAGFAGHHIQSFLQNTWVLALSGVLFILLSMSLFGLYELQLPHWLQSKLLHFSHEKKHGPFINAALMGIFSSLVVSPCVSAPLVGALAYIGGTGNPWLGAGSLFFMGIGMGAPLLIIGASAGKILPKSGRWMSNIKNFFGIMLIGMAIWLWSRILPAHFIMGLWSVLAIVCGIYLGVLDRTEIGWPRFWKAIGIILCLYGLCLFVGAASGSANMLAPLENFSSEKNSTTFSSAPTHGLFKQISTTKELEAALKNHQLTLVDFYADWCESCQVMKHEVFDTPEVQAAFAKQQVQLLQVDMTKSTPEIQTLLDTYHLIAPPTILFFNAQGAWLKNSTLVGLQTKEAVIKAVDEFY